MSLFLQQVTHLWVVECFHLTLLASPESNHWDPILHFGCTSKDPSHHIPGVYMTREAARKAAWKMEETNRYNKPKTVCNYRARRYNRS
jgi:hypothetical protein